MAQQLPPAATSSPMVTLKSPKIPMMGLVGNPLMNSASGIPGFGVPTQNAKVEIALDNDALWSRFNEHTTEMIVTKTGRRMFPTLRNTLTGLDPNASYAVFLEFCPVDDCRYKFQQGRWVVAGRADQHSQPVTAIGAPNPRIYAHPDSPAPGRIWMRQPVSFHRIKLTNNPSDPHGHVLLSSMHKYRPRVFVLRLNDFYPGVPQMVASASFAETTFVAVTAYQNERVIQLKIDHNPFAKGFRESVCQQTLKRNTSQSPTDNNPPTTEDTDGPLCKRPSLDGRIPSVICETSTITPNRSSAFAAVNVQETSTSPDHDRVTANNSKDSSSAAQNTSSESLSPPKLRENNPVTAMSTYATPSFNHGALGSLPMSPFQSPLFGRMPSSLFPGPASGQPNPYLHNFLAVSNPYLSFNPFSAAFAAAALPIQQQYMQTNTWYNPTSALLAHSHHTVPAIFKGHQ